MVHQRNARLTEDIPEVQSEYTRRMWREKEDSRRDQFIRGPLPMTWLERAALQPGKALAVAMLLWFMKGMIGDEPIAVSAKLLNRFKIGRKAGARALEALKKSGLIEVDRGKGRQSRVRINQIQVCRRGES